MRNSSINRCILFVLAIAFGPVKKAGRIRGLSKASTHSVMAAALPWNRWQAYSGISGRYRVEYPSANGRDIAKKFEDVLCGGIKIERYN